MSASKSKKYTDEEKVYWDLEPEVLYDYVNFANRLRVLQAGETDYKKYNMDQDGKRMHLVLLTELYQKSLEDLAVILLALFRRFNTDASCEFQKEFSSQTPLVYTLINYKIREAEIKKILDKLPSQRDFISGLHINDLDSLHLELLIPKLNKIQFYSELYSNVKDWMGDQEKRFRIYNKIKHGPIVLGSGKILNKTNPNSPAVVYSDRGAKFTDHPLVVHHLHFTEDEFLLLQAGVFKISDCIKDLLAIYLCKNYPDFLKKKGFSSPLIFFKERRPKK